MNEEVKEHLEKLTDLWDTGNNVEFAYEVALLYGSGDHTLIFEVMKEFEEWIKTLYMCNGCN